MAANLFCILLDPTGPYIYIYKLTAWWISCTNLFQAQIMTSHQNPDTYCPSWNISQSSNKNSATCLAYTSIQEKKINTLANIYAMFGIRFYHFLLKSI